MKALVTGGAGFIGSHVVERLVETGAAVTVLDNLATGRLENLSQVAGRVTIENIDMVTADIAPLLAARDFDLIVHAAGNADVAASVSNPRRDVTDNVVTTLSLLEAVRSSSPRSAIVGISSAAVYAEAGIGAMTEDYATQPASPYGIDKLAAETYVTLYARIHGLRTSTVRVFSVFGPRLRKQVVWDFMTRLTENPQELVINGDGSEQRNPSHVRNIADAIVLVAERSPMTGDIYNVGSPASVSISQLARDVADAMGLRPDIRVTGQRGKGHARAWLADITRLESLGYRESVSYSDGLADTVAWFKSLHVQEA